MTVTLLIVEFADLKDKGTVIVGTFGDKYRASDMKADSFAAYTIIGIGLLRKGSVIMADNTVMPDSPEYLTFVRAHPKFENRTIWGELEYMTALKDALEVSTY
ncbi:hypothetical protein SmJEL517_g05217 [Synchytrium microbalum]|uniref:Uncharacterized protein n=1 Tax=Synchytrium microbalum TaxID=1806994 RepID=A0A507BQJ4_9FUNG|nr:uncharacterized protein SmJEL517_g05217 [Synchytrium microbalum]TPX31487.1 hypothetical protein SmJEL517_g05217 [Synchytrium microbalum]